MVTIVLRSI